MYKICHIIFSTNRLEYLIPNLRSQYNLNFYNCDVDKIFIDDYPKTRNNNLIKSLVNIYGFKEIYLHENNVGLSATWKEFWEIVKDRGYDYIFHQEDDIIFQEPILITDLIELLEKDSTIGQIQLARQAWYYHEKNPEASDDDFIYKNYRFRKESTIFSPMASLYPTWITRIPFHEHYEFNINEGMIGKFLFDHYGKLSANVRNYYGRNIIEHIGEWSIGKRVIQGEPGYDNWSHINPDLKHNSKNGLHY